VGNVIAEVVEAANLAENFSHVAYGTSRGWRVYTSTTKDPFTAKPERRSIGKDHAGARHSTVVVRTLNVVAATFVFAAPRSVDVVWHIFH